MRKKHSFFCFLLLAVATNQIADGQTKKKGKKSYSVVQSDEGKTIFLNIRVDHIAYLLMFKNKYECIYKCNLFRLLIVKNTELYHAFSWLGITI